MLLLECGGRHESEEGREEWRKGGRVAWIFKPKRQNVADKKRQREIRIGIGMAGTRLSVSLS
jgi:hypothetical protein